jgi:hypothetical protein
MPLEVFLSHAHRDARVAEALVTFLHMGAGIPLAEIRCTSFDPTGLHTGSNINVDLRKDLKRCKYVLPLITANTPDSEFVSFELGAAWVLEKEIIPLTFRLRARQKMPSVLSALLYTDLTSEAALIKLASNLTSKIFHAADQSTPLQIVAATRHFLSVVCPRR